MATVRQPGGASGIDIRAEIAAKYRAEAARYDSMADMSDAKGECGDIFRSHPYGRRAEWLEAGEPFELSQWSLPDRACWITSDPNQHVMIERDGSLSLLPPRSLPR